LDTATQVVACESRVERSRGVKRPDVHAAKVLAWWAVPTLRLLVCGAHRTVCWLAVPTLRSVGGRCPPYGWIPACDGMTREWLSFINSGAPDHESKSSFLEQIKLLEPIAERVTAEV